MKKNIYYLLPVLLFWLSACGPSKENEMPAEDMVEETPNAGGIYTPFSYNVGINYESWTMGRDSRVIATDLQNISTYFRLIKTFHTAGVGTTSVVMDPTQIQVINFVTANPSLNMELIMGTNSSALAQGGYGSPWTAGLMTTQTYTDAWVDTLVKIFGGQQQVLQYLKCICLGNEVDANGPPSDSSEFTPYFTSWIQLAFKNLSASLKKNGLQNIPVTTIIANYPSDSAANPVAYVATKYIYTNWQSTWNNGKAFVFFNQYTQDGGKSTNVKPVIDYFTTVQNQLGNNCQVFVGETGYSSEYDSTGKPNEATMLAQVFNWMYSQQSSGGKNIPLCIFQAFDHSQKPPGQQKMGLFKYTKGIFGIKDSISIPAWTVSPISTGRPKK